MKLDLVGLSHYIPDCDFSRVLKEKEKEREREREKKKKRERERRKKNPIRYNETKSEIIK